MLLNPHGSDETEARETIGGKAYVFLTHTVQMKPTIMGMLMYQGEKLLNPHGSDETGCYESS